MLQEDKGFYELCFDSLLEGLCITDKYGTIVMSNSALENIFGYQKNELLHKNIEVIIPQKYRSLHLNHVKSYFQDPKEINKEFGKRFFGLRKDGKEISIEISLNYMKYGGKGYAKALISDISSRMQEEIKIKEAKLELEKEVKKQTKELSFAVKKLEDSNKRLKNEIHRKVIAENNANIAFQREKELNLLQTKFLSLASHEFKTPLSGILSSAVLIEKYNNLSPNDNIQNHIITIKRLSKQLNSVLDDFLFLEKTETKKVNYHFSEFLFCENFDKIIKNTRSVLRKGQKIKMKPCDEDILVLQDKNIVEIIFRNILYNAIKYSPENSRIKIKISCTKHIRVKIKDEGIGIPKEDQKHIFERFFRAKNALHFQGTGIGLNIVKYHVEELGGSVSFKSKEGKGTSFTIKLPIRMSIKE
ncbi:MAG: PAS domain-containing sensor histidine kinase [Bacteroidota bacterium]